MDNQCPQGSMSASEKSQWRGACAPAALMPSAKHTATFWLLVLLSGSVCIALAAALSIAIGAKAHASGTVTKILQTRTQTAYLFDGIPPYTEECTQEGISTVNTLPPGLTVEYAQADAFCTSDGSGNGRLTLLVTGKCRLVRWQGAVIESPCTWLPVAMR